MAGDKQPVVTDQMIDAGFKALIAGAYLSDCDRDELRLAMSSVYAAMTAARHVEVTAKMARAGGDVLVSWNTCAGLGGEYDEVATEVFLTMLKASAPKEGAHD